MTDSGFAVQANYKFGPGGQDMLNVRGDNVAEFAQALTALKGGINVIQELGALIRDVGPATTEQAVATIQNEFPGAQVVGPPQVAPTPPPPADPWATGGGTPPQAAPVAPGGAQCPACSRGTACPDCGTATALGLKVSKNRGQSYNAHMCTANEKHKVVWCKTPIPYALQGAMGNPGLVYG